MALAAVVFAGLTGFLARRLGASARAAWALGAAVLPAAVLVAEFALPYAGGGASMWPIALVVGAVLGGAGSALGVLLSSRLPRRSS